MKSVKNNLKMLVVDDDDQSRNLLLEIFKPHSYDVLTAENGRDALLKFKQSHVSIIITDLQMPIMDGLELIKAIRCIDSEVPVIAVSGEKTMLPMALSLGANAALEKPFSFEGIVELVKQHQKV